jgi:hypothetical protein
VPASTRLGWWHPASTQPPPPRPRTTAPAAPVQVTVEIGAIEIVEDVRTAAQDGRRPPVSLGEYLRSRGGA